MDINLDVLDNYRATSRRCINLDELNSDHNPILRLIKVQILQNTSHCVRWDELRQYLKLKKFSLDAFTSIDILGTGIEAFSNSFRSAKLQANKLLFEDGT